MITKYKIFEELSIPFTDETPFVYSQHYNNNFQGFKDEFIADMKAKLVGKKIRIDGERQYGFRDKPDPIDDLYTSDGKHIKPLYEITVKDVVFNGVYRQETYYINIIDSENKIYKLKKIVSDKTWANFVKKAGKELARIEEEKLRKERLKIKHFHHDPYGEEVWEEDDLI